MRVSVKLLSHSWLKDQAPGISVQSDKSMLVAEVEDNYRTIASSLTISKHARVFKLKKNSCKMEDFVETHICKLRMTLRSRVLRVLCHLMKTICS